MLGSGGEDQRRESDSTRLRQMAVVAVAWVTVTSVILTGSGVALTAPGRGVDLAGDVRVGGTPVNSGADEAMAGPNGRPGNGCDVPRGPAGTINLSESGTELSGGSADDRAGWSVTTAGDVNGDGYDDVLVGAPTNDTGGRNAGAAYLFYGPVNRTALDVSAANVTFVGETRGDRAGFSVAAGDVNGDGNADIVVGAPLNDGAGTEAGAAYVVYGDESLAGTIDLSNADATLVGAGAGDRAGWSLATANNVSNGTSAVVVGAPRNDSVAPDAGAAYLVTADSLSRATDLSGATVTFVGESEGDLAGFSVATGDVDNDTATDVLIGARHNDSTAPEAGAAYLLYGPFRSEAEILANADAKFRGSGESDNAGFAVAAGGDLNNDSYDDVLIGAPFNDSTAPDAGAAYVVYGNESLSRSVNLSAADVTLAGEGGDDLAGWSVAVAGDANGDGYDDALVGAPYNDSTAPDAGAGYLLYGSRLSRTHDLTGAHAKLRGAGEDDLAGYDVSGAGDVNNDTAADVLIGAPYNDSHRNAGAAYLMRGDCPSEPSKTTTRTPTPTTETPTETTGEPTTTPTPEPLDVTVRFDCTRATVDADQYTEVVLHFRDGSVQQFRSIYTGRNTFSGTGSNDGKVITRVEVFDGPDAFRAIRSDAEGCEPATTTPEEPFTPRVFFTNCDRAVVEADAYDSIKLAFADGTTQTFSGPYEGRNVFFGTGANQGKVLDHVVVRNEDEKVVRNNPNVGACTETTAAPTTTTATTTTTTTPRAFEPTVEFATCGKAVVKAHEYRSVTLRFADGTEQSFFGPFEGRNVFFGTGANQGKVLERVVVRGDGERVSRSNPTLDRCLAAPPPTTTVTPTTTTPPTTTTTTTTATPAPTTTTREPLQDVQVDTECEVAAVTNPNDVPVRVTITLRDDGAQTVEVEPETRQRLQFNRTGTFTFTAEATDGRPVDVNGRDEYTTEIEACPTATPTTTTTTTATPTTTPATTTTTTTTTTATTTTPVEPTTTETTTPTTTTVPPTTTTAVNHLVIVGGSPDNVIEYGFTVDGDVEKSGEGGEAPISDENVTIDEEDRISDGRVSGTLTGGGDAYRFTGNVTRFRVSLTAETSDEVAIYLNGEEVEPDELGTNPAEPTPIEFVNCTTARVTGTFEGVALHTTFRDEAGVGTNWIFPDAIDGTAIVRPVEPHDGDPFAIDSVSLRADGPIETPGGQADYVADNPYAGPWCLDRQPTTTAAAPDETTTAPTTETTTTTTTTAATTTIETATPTITATTTETTTPITTTATATPTLAPQTTETTTATTQLTTTTTATASTTTPTPTATTTTTETTTTTTPIPTTTTTTTTETTVTTTETTTPLPTPTGTPQRVPDNSTCAELGLERAIELEYDEQRREFVAENGTGLGENHYRFEINGEQYAVNLTEVTVADGEPVSFNWTSSLRMAAVIVTGGPDANVYSFDGALGRAELRAPINENAGQNYAIGNVSFCYDPGTPNAVENAGFEGRDPATPIDALGAFVALLAGAVLVHRRD